MSLNVAHPDIDRKAGDTRDYKGTKYIFGVNQFSAFWRAGPKDGTVVCSRDFTGGFDGDRPYRVGAVYFLDFDKAADFARQSAKKEYERALDIVRRYEAHDDKKGK